MSGYDILAWIVLVILLASAIGVFCIAGWLLGHIAKSRNHPYAQAVTLPAHPDLRHVCMILRQIAIVNHVNPF